MVEKIEVVLRENNTTVETITKPADATSSKFIHAIQEVQKLTNELLTKMIEAKGQSTNVMESDEDEDYSSEGENNVLSSPKKRKN